MKLVPILATATLVAGSVGASVPASAAGLTTFCDGTAAGVTIPGDLFVPAGRSCLLTDVTVTGDTEVSYGADLVVTGGSFAGDVLVRNGAFLDLVGASMEGQVTNRGFGVFAEATHIGGTITARAVNREIVPFTFLLDAHLVGGLDSRGADAFIDGSEVGGAVAVVGGDAADAYDSTLGGDLTVTGTGSSVVCESEVAGNAAFTGIRDGLQLGAGTLADCADALGTFWGGDVAVNDSTGGVEVSRNVVRGDLSGEGNDPAPVGGDNRVRGEVSGQFVDLAPAAEAAGAQTRSTTAQLDASAGLEVSTDRKGQLTAEVQQRRIATVAEAQAAGPIM